MVETQSEIIKTLRKIYAKYDYYVRESRMKVKTDSYLITCILASVIIFVAFLLFNIFFLHIPPNNFNAYKLPLLILFVVADLSISYPYLLTSARIAKIEEALPDALKQMSDTLRAGGTYEFALREISNSNYGPLSEEMELALRGLEEGQNFEQVLKKFSDKTESTLVRRTMTIITESLKAGAGLAEVLDDVADEMREMYRISLERKSKTMMQVLFMVAAGIIVAPIIFGMVGTIIKFLISSVVAGGTISNKAVIVAANNDKDFILFLIEAYIFIEVIVSTIMVSLLRYGSFGRTFILAPIFLLLTAIIYFVAGIVISGMVAV